MGVLAHLSHEIRTPLNSILALSQLLREGMAGALNPEQQKYVEVIERNGHNLLGLVSDFLDLSRMDTGRIEVDIRTLDLGDHLRSTAALLVPLAEIKKIGLIVEPAVDDLPPVRCDLNRLRQILTNLVGNAIRFTDCGQVVMSAEVRGDAVAVHVSDTGVGIPEAARCRVFDEFFQVTPSDTRRHGGTGLGLAIANRLVRLMGGEMSVQSVEGTGSRFTFTLPRADRERMGAGDLRGGGGHDSDGEKGGGEGHDGGRRHDSGGYRDGGTEGAEPTNAGMRGRHPSRGERHGTNTAGR